MQVPFNRPLVLGTEQENIADVISSGSMAANGTYTAKCNALLQELGYRKALLTTSCTAALEMAALMLDLGPDDEVIVPSYAFVTTANAFASKGATIMFADSSDEHPNINPNEIERLVSPNTKAIVSLHYGGVACDMDAVQQLASSNGISIIEDNAQGIGASHSSGPLGSIGDFGAISFHETKNVHCGEGGALIVNREVYDSRSDVVWEMGTNKKEFKEGKVDSYGWVDLGSSYYPSELNAAFLCSQLFELDRVSIERIGYWNNYHTAFERLEKEGRLIRPKVPGYANHNAHIYYLETGNRTEREDLISWLKSNGIGAAFHFQSLHKSSYFKDRYHGPELKNSDRFSETLVRLPLYYGLANDQNLVIEKVLEFYQK